MDAADYRRKVQKQVQNAIARQSAPQLEASAEPATIQLTLQTQTALLNENDAATIESLVSNPAAQAGLRAAAVSRLGFGDDARVDLERLIELLRDGAEPAEVRLEAMRKLKAAAFERGDFADVRPAYLSALRDCLDAADRDLLEAAASTLMAQEDPETQATILSWLENPQDARLPTGVVLQLLSYNVHAGIPEAVRGLAEDGATDQDVRLEALRLLGADGASSDLFRTIARDKNEDPEARRIASVALRSLAPDDFQNEALSVLEDEGDDDSVRATMLSGLAYSNSFIEDDVLRTRIESSCAGSKSSVLRTASEKHLGRTASGSSRAGALRRGK